MTTAPAAYPPPPTGPLPPTGPPPSTGPEVPAVPDPPPGPGVYPPFPAPPVEGRGRRIGLGLGIGAVVLVLVCGGAFAAAVGLGAVMTRAINEQAHVVIGKYFDALEQGKYADAYGMQCESEKQRQTQAEFTAEQSTQDRIQSSDVGDVDLTAVQLTVPVDVTYTDGSTNRLEVYLDQNPDTGEFQVCGVEE
ncbi:hypothetical protein EV385_4511 [Krasilnikovia cinnamomea]|uniref:DUF4878 domain-containing protein n=1 Tax=Krasilnikovia cinnamomea TaxID=349313 RepID=A0A4Q7ZNM0_9ACTN|nr:hypothetical protein [Krasilnikovia cinnamomea]RZU52637.1 hypothetical protein EV385_4511 [Krasilnikovia cinnamomea]